MSNDLIELLRIAVGLQEGFTHALTEDEWKELYDEVKKQSIVGVCFAGIEGLPKEQLPPRELIMQWYGYAECIRLQHVKQREALLRVCQLLKSEKLNFRIMKGLGVAAYYHTSNNSRMCSELRSLGDFDIWISASKTHILNFARKYGRVGDVVYHHVDAGQIMGVECELHFHPTSLKNVIANNRMQRWFDERFDDKKVLKVNGQEIPVTSLEFNRVYILNHIYRHLLYEGVGLRQFLDYYFVLKASATMDKSMTRELIRRFKMENFSNAITWVMLYIFAPKALLTDVLPDWVVGLPDEWRGRTLLHEMVMGGNFGHANRDKKYMLTDHWIKRYTNRIRYDMKFLRQYPEEVLWRPVWFVWERWNKWCER